MILPWKHNSLICTAWVDFLIPRWLITGWKMSGRLSLEEVWLQRNMMIFQLCCLLFNLAIWLPLRMFSLIGPCRKTNLIRLNLYTLAWLIEVLELEVQTVWKVKVPLKVRCSCGRLITTGSRQPCPSDKEVGRGALFAVCAETYKIPTTSSLVVL